jgi:outer membrane protein assembly factor BamB
MKFQYTMRSLLLTITLALQLFGQSNFRFVHITDTHIGSTTGAEDLRRTVSDINSLKTVSFAVVTGDITEFGSDDQMRLAKQILDSLTIPWYCIPGNHDMKWSESGGTSFGKIFGDERFVFDYGGYKFIGLHQGPRMRMGDAFWTRDDVSWLESILSSMPDKNQRVIIATHYPADSGIANWYNVTTVARKYNVQAFLNGHWHQNHFAVYDGIPSVVGRSNLREKDTIGGYNIVDIRNDTMFYSSQIPGFETKKPWIEVKLGDRDYSSDRLSQNDVRTEFYQQYPNVSFTSKMTYASSMNCPPVITKKYRVYAYQDGTVWIYDSNKNEYITINTNSPIMASPALDDKRIVISTTDSTISCYAIATQKILWTIKTGAAVVAPPVIKDGVVYCGASDRKFRAIDLKSGKVRWSYDSLRGHVEARPLLADGKVIVGAWDEHLYCFDEKTGKLVWKWKNDRPGILFSPAACEPVYAHNKVFIVAPDRFMTAIDIKTGRQIWRTNAFKVRESIGISENRERVYIRTMNDSLYALSTRSLVPKVIWGLNAGFGYDINSSQIKEKEGVVFFTTKNGELFAVEGSSGKLLWKFKEDVVIAHTPIPLSRNRVIFSNVVGTVCEVVANKKHAIKGKLLKN